MTLHVGVSGVNKDVPDLWVGVAAVWKKVSDVWVGVGGVWKQAYQSVTVNLLGLDPMDVQVSPTDATAIYALTNTGSEDATNGSSSTWLLTGVASDYEARATVTAGTLTTGTTGSWLNLGTSRQWTKARTSNISGVDTASMTIEISLAGVGAAIATATVDLTAEVI